MKRRATLFDEMASQRNDLLTVRTVVPRSDLAYRQFLVASLLLAVLVGFVLGIHVTVSRLLDIGRPERTADLIQAHGQVQLLGFAGLFVIGMSQRLLPRFAGAPLQLAGLLPVVLWSMVASLVLRAAVLPWTSGDTHHALLLSSTFGVLVACSAYLLLVSGTLAFGARHRADASSAAFLLGAVMLYAASAIATLAVIKEGAGGAQTVPYLVDTAVTQVELLGFLAVFVVGVALRALPVLVGRERPERGSSLLPLFLAACVAVHAASLLYIDYGSYSEALAMLDRRGPHGGRAGPAGVRLAGGRAAAAGQPHASRVAAGVVVVARRLRLAADCRGADGATSAAGPS